MVVQLGPVINHGHDVGVVVLVVVVERVEEKAEAVPSIGAAENWAFVTFRGCVPVSIKLW